MARRDWHKTACEEVTLAINNAMHNLNQRSRMDGVEVLIVVDLGFHLVQCTPLPSIRSDAEFLRNCGIRPYKTPTTRGKQRGKRKDLRSK